MGKSCSALVSQHDETAFEELLARHGPMVLAVCKQLFAIPRMRRTPSKLLFLCWSGGRPRSVNRNGSLAGSTGLLTGSPGVRGPRRRDGTRERQGVEMVAVATLGQLPSDDIRPVVHEEVNRLPEKYRTPVVLCYLEGKTQDEAAKDLGCTKGVLKGRLERARTLLRKRLLRRGLTLSAGALTAVLCPARQRSRLPWLPLR